MKTLKSLAIISILSSTSIQAQNIYNLYVPALNFSTVNIQVQQIIPFCLDINSFTQDNYYWSVSADAIAQSLYKGYAGDNTTPIYGDIFHPRFGYAFMNHDSLLKSGIAVDAPIRTNEGFGLGLTLFMKIIPNNKILILMPQFSFGKFTRNGNDANGGGTYVSAEVDMMVKLGKTTGISLKPYLFSFVGSPEDHLQLGFKIGFSKFLKSSGANYFE